MAITDDESSVMAITSLPQCSSDHSAVNGNNDFFFRWCWTEIPLREAHYPFGSRGWPGCVWHSISYLGTTLPGTATACEERVETTIEVDSVRRLVERQRTISHRSTLGGIDSVSRGSPGTSLD